MSECLLIVDVQVGFINEFTVHIPKLVEKLQNNYKYVYITKFFNKKNSFYRKLIKWERFDIESEDFQLAFNPVKHAIILNKSIYSCVNEDFIQDLNNKNITEIDICGIDTDICVTKCAVDLFEQNIIPFVLADYCGNNAGIEANMTAFNTLNRFIGKSQVVFK